MRYRAATVRERFLPQAANLNHEGDTVIDPFGGSCVTGEVCERLRRNWPCIEMREEYLKRAVGRFDQSPLPQQEWMFDPNSEGSAYKLRHPAVLWNEREGPLEADGGKERRNNAGSRG